MNKLLLIEKDKPIIQRFKKAMVDNNIEVDHCSTIGELSERLNHLDEYEVVLVDIEYKNMLRRMVGISDRPFYIMWTNSAECSPEIEECLSTGASLYMKKDKDMKKVISLIKRVEQAYISNYLY